MSASRRALAHRPVVLAVLALACGAVLGCASTSARAADPLPLYKEGIARKKSGDLDAAERSFRACLAADPAYGRCHFSLGVLLKKRGALDEAEAAFRKAIAAYPSWGEAHLSLGMTLLKKGDADAAKVELEAAVADKDLEADDRGEAWNALGVMHRQAGRWQDAVAAYDHAIAAQPARASFHQHKAIALEHLKDAAAMEAAVRKAIDLEGGDGTSWLLLGRALGYQGKDAEGRAALRKATELAPKDATAWYALGVAAEAAGDKVEARRAFEAYLPLAATEGEREPVRRRLDDLAK